MATQIHPSSHQPGISVPADDLPPKRAACFHAIQPASDSRPQMSSQTCKM
jgi:hypothetical protein